MGTRTTTAAPAAATAPSVPAWPTDPTSQVIACAGVADLRPGEQVADELESMNSRDADPDQDEAVAARCRRARPARRSRPRLTSAPTEGGPRDASRAGLSNSTIAGDGRTGSAPEVIPTKSGEASGLRSSCWKIGPGDAEGEPDSHAGRPRSAGAGSRTTKSTAGVVATGAAARRAPPRAPMAEAADHHRERRRGRHAAAPSAGRDQRRSGADARAVGAQRRASGRRSRGRLRRASWSRLTAPPGLR